MRRHPYNTSNRQTKGKRIESNICSFLRPVFLLCTSLPLNIYFSCFWRGSRPVFYSGQNVGNGVLLDLSLDRHLSVQGV